MSDNSMGEDASIDLTVNADEALQVFEQLASAARDADDQLQRLKQHLTEQVTATFGAQGQQPQTYQQASAVLSRMDPAEVSQAAPDIAQTKNALTARSADIQAQAMDFAGTTPGLATQPPADVLAQFQGSYTLLMMAVGSLSAIYSETASHTHLRRPVSPVARLWGVLPANCLATRRSPERRQRPHHQKCV